MNEIYSNTSSLSEIVDPTAPHSFLDRLPNEILSSIFAFLDPREPSSWNILLVSKKFKILGQKILDPSCDDLKWLVWAFKVGNSMAIKRLVSDPRVFAVAKKNLILFWACQKGELEIVQKILKDPHSNIEFDTEGVSLIEAIAMGHLEIVRELLKDGRIDPGYANDGTLVYACQKGYFEIVRELVKDGRVNPKSELALTMAKNHHREDIVKLLESNLDK